MVLAGEINGKGLYNESTGKMCEGCCGPQPEACSNCPSGTTPLTIQVTFTGLADQCAGCPTIGGIGNNVSGDMNFSWAALLNGTHTLTQTESCRWEKTLSLGSGRQLDLYNNDPSCPDCSGSPAQSVDAEAIGVPLNILVTKFNSTTMTVVAESPESGSSIVWSATTSGSLRCFDHGSFTPILGLIFGGATSTHLILGNNITITE